MGEHPLSTPAAGPTRRARELLPPALLWLSASAVVALLALRVHTPVRYHDEFLFWGVARSLAEGSGVSWHGIELQIISLLYPLLIAPIFRVAGSVQDQYELVRVVNSVMITAVVFPVYLAARQKVAPALAALAAALAVAAPAVNYAGLIGTESLAYPLAAAALLALVHALARATTGGALVAVLLMLAAIATRMQFVALVPIAVLSLLAVVLVPGAAGRRQRLAERRVLAGALALLLLIGLLYVLVRGRASVGIYLGVLGVEHFAAEDLWHWLRVYSADVYLVAGILPAIATLALLGSRENREDPFTLALLAVTITASVVFILQQTWFSAVNVEGWRERNILQERYMFYLAPLYFVGLVVSVRRVGARAVAISTAAGALVLALFPTEALRVPSSLDAMSLTYLGYLTDAHPQLSGRAGLLLAALALLLGGLYLLAARGFESGRGGGLGLKLTMLLTFFVLLLSQAKAWEYQETFSASVLRGAGQSVDWVDRAATGPVAVLYGRGSSLIELYQIEFWNPSVRRVFVSPKAPVESPPIFSPRCLFEVSDAGRITADPLPGCELVPRNWLTTGRELAITLRDDEQHAAPDPGRHERLHSVGGSPQVLALVGGRDLGSGVVAQELAIRSFAEERGRIRISARASGGAAELRLGTGRALRVAGDTSARLAWPIAEGDQLSRMRVSAPGSRARLKVTKIELREGDGPWRSIR